MLHPLRDAHRDSVQSVDLDGLVCPPLPISDRLVEEHVVKKDETRLTTAFVDWVAAATGECLARDGVLLR